ncbi:MAG: nuclear transport factor 2 family protein, partial [Phycisphaerae bacterium]|nr:nuclear transport factor 2 family protein [Phycisphaerae bacterium]
DPMFVTTGLESVALVYRRMSGDIAAEVFFLSPDALIIRSISHYG